MHSKSSSVLYLSQSGLVRYQNQLRRIQKEYNQWQVWRQLTLERAQCAWPQHPDYAYAKHTEERYQQEIQQLASLITEAHVFSVREGFRPKGCVSLGSVLEVRCGSSDFTWEIGGHGDCDPVQGRIAYNSLLGQTLMGLKIGDRVSAPKWQNMKWQARTLEIRALKARRGRIA